MSDFNIILDTDSYKSGHYLQYPKGTTKLFAYLESRGGEYDQTVFFGLQYILKRYLTQPISVKDVEEAHVFFKTHHLPFPYKGWLYIAKTLKGNIPLKISAVQEGTVVPIKNILFRVESTDEKVFWIVTWFETLLLRVWYPITVATRSWHMKKLIAHYLEKTSDTPEEISFKLHDFGARGVSSAESAGIGGAAHLVNFSGSDTIQGMLYANKYYQANLTPSSIPAAEHSCIMVFEKDNEEKAYKHIIDTLSKQSNLLALPVDTYNIDHALTLLSTTLKNDILNCGATVVIRLDSGDPITVVIKALQKLEKAFGTSTNKKGYKVLNNVRVLHSDQINYATVDKILNACLKKKFSATNLVFGMGGQLLQKLDRDTQKFAYKVSLAEVDKTFIPVQKQPVGAKGKKSKSGYLDLIQAKQGYKTVVNETHAPRKDSALRLVFENGKLLIDDNLDKIRNTTLKNDK